MSHILFVDGAVGSDLNSGSSAGATPIADGTGAAWDLDSTTIDLSADTPDLSGVSSDGTETIRIHGQNEGEGTSDIFTITGVDDGAKTVTVRATPGAAESGVTWVIGGATVTISRALATVYNDQTNEPKIWVKGSTTYTETVTHGSLGVVACWCVVEGYSTTPGDNGIVIIDGENTRDYGWTGFSGTNFLVVKNFQFKNHVKIGFGSSNRDYLIVKRCRANNNGTDGFFLDDITVIVDCYAHNNGGRGFYGGSTTQIRNCISADNGTKGIQIAKGLVWKCLVVGNGTVGIERDSTGGTAESIVASCTVDGKNKTTQTGISINGGRTPVVENCIVTGCVTGIAGSLASMTQDHVTSQENLLYDNTANYSNWRTEDGEVLADPAFINAAGGDWGLQNTSAARNTGTNPAAEGWITSEANRAYIGALPTLPPSAACVSDPGFHIQGDLG